MTLGERIDRRHRRQIFRNKRLQTSIEIEVYEIIRRITCFVLWGVFFEEWAIATLCFDVLLDVFGWPWDRMWDAG